MVARFTSVCLIVMFLACCHEDDRGRPIGASCVHVADCQQGLVCAFDSCRSPCEGDHDCQSGLCVDWIGDVDYRVCTIPPLETSCAASEDCPYPLFCADDGRCRNSCDETAPCGEGRECIFYTCVEPDGALRILTETTFEDFADGTLPQSLESAYVSADGAVRTILATDLNDDGHADLVFTNAAGEGAREVSSHIYWGSEDWFSPENRTDLPTSGASAAAVADLNIDGYLDLVVANQVDDSGNTSIDSSVFWGSADGFSGDRSSAIPTKGATGVAVADLNVDGYLDLVFANRGDVGSCDPVDSWIYWGSADGFGSDSRSSVPTMTAVAVDLGDLDGDGWLDLVFGSEGCAGSSSDGSPIFWGSASGFSLDRFELLAAPDASSVTMADMDADGSLDIVLSSRRAETELEAGVWVFSSSGAGFGDRPSLVLPMLQPAAVSIARIESSSRLGIVVSNGSRDTETDHSSRIFWCDDECDADGAWSIETYGAAGNQALYLDELDYFADVVFANGGRDGGSLVCRATGSGYGEDCLTLPTLDASMGVTRDVGNAYDRGDQEVYVSSVIDLGEGARISRMALDADVLSNDSSIVVQLRSAQTPEGIIDAPWRGPSADEDLYRGPRDIVNPAHHGDRFVQYKAIFTDRSHRSIVSLLEVAFLLVVE